MCLILLNYHDNFITNQIIYIKSAKGLKAEQINSAVWVSGMLNAKSVSTIVANVGYTINEASVTSYSSW